MGKREMAIIGGAGHRVARSHGSKKEDPNLSPWGVAVTHIGKEKLQSRQRLNNNRVKGLRDAAMMTVP